MPDPRGTRQARGYDHHHEQLRAQLVAAATPDTECPRCHQPLGDPQAAHLGHTDDRASYHGLEHSRCNVTAANQARRHGHRGAARQRDQHPA